MCADTCRLKSSVQYHLNARGYLKLSISERCLLELRDKCLEVGPSEKKKKRERKSMVRRECMVYVGSQSFNKEKHEVAVFSPLLELING